ncbi:MULTISPECIES: TonB-dependent receptor [Dyella]|uniref:TonB-dependent receptor n=1 Tax=Dyella TaxID=231454 RepID=UPI001F0D5E37|nr:MULTISPECIES: TonB-dependent receptor [Dyella]
MNNVRSPFVRRHICTAIAVVLMGPLAAHAYPGDGDEAATSAQGQAQTTQSTDAKTSTSPDKKPVELGTVMVSANKRSERLQDVPMAVSVMSDTQLERQHAVNFADYATQIPGMNFISSGEGQTQLVLRGITSGSGQPNATVGTYIDDSPYGSSTVYSAGSVLTPDIDPSDLQRIEVLRGPQGTLYGSNTLGGLVKFVSTPPDATQASGRLSADASSVDGGGNGFGVRAMGNVPLIKDQLALRVNAYSRTDPGYIDNVNTGDKEVNEVKVDGGRAQLLWTPNAMWNVRLSALAQNLNSDGIGNGGVDVDPNTLRPIYGDDKQWRAAGTGLFKLKYRLYDLSINGDFGWAKLVSTTSYGTLRLNENVDATQAYGPLLNPAFGIDNGGYSIAQRIALNKTTQELRLQSPTDQAWEWRVGVFYTQEKTTDTQDVMSFDALTGTPIALPTLASLAIGPAKFTEWAGYGDLTWHATDKLSVQVGARYSSDDTTYKQTGDGALTGPSDFQTRSKDHPTTYLFSPSYKITPDTMTYLRIASGFRPGGPNVGVPPGLGAPLSFGPDKLTSYELGLKSLFLEHRMSVELAAFYIDWKQVQLTTSTGGFSFLGNGGKASSEGLEASWRYSPVAGLTLWANATYTKAELKADTPPGGLYGYKGDTLPYVPKWNGNLGVDYNFPLGEGWSGFVGGNYSYVGSRESDFNAVPSPRIHLPSYSNIGLQAGVNRANWTVTLYAKNLTNQRGITSTAALTLDPTASPYQASYQTPRTIGISASVDF